MVSKSASGKRTVKDILLDRKVIKEADLEKAQEAVKKTGRPLQQVVMDLHLADKIGVLTALSSEWRVKAVDLSEIEIDPEVVKIIPEQNARRHLALPFAKEESTLLVAMAEPRDFFISEDIHLRTGLDVQGYLSLPEDIIREMDKVYGVSGTSGVQVSEIMKDIGQKKDELPEGEMGAIEKLEKKLDVTDVDASAPEVERIVNAIILGALQQKASDIHIEPFEDATGNSSRIIVRYRVDGFLHDAGFQLPWSYRNAVIAKLKIMTESMNITERRIPQSGRIQVMAKGNPIEFRVEMIPTIYGESCVMRILDRKSVQVDVQKLGFLPDTMDKFLDLLKGIGGKKNFGLIIVCGPTGSGKSTTLYAALNHVNRPDIKILTAENPVEYNLDGIVQVPVNPDLKLGENKYFNFSTALRSFLRLDPDIIMVGEIRDRETAQIAMEAAMTGHLVFSTIHTNDAPSVIARLTEMKIPAFLVATTIKAVLAQRLVRRICSSCRVAIDPNPGDLKVFADNGLEYPEGAKLYKGKGCQACRKSGFKGRAGIHELMVLTEAIRSLTLKEVAADPIRKLAIEEGMRTIIQDGLVKALEGLTTVREVLGGTGE